MAKQNAYHNKRAQRKSVGLVPKALAFLVWSGCALAFVLGSSLLLIAGYRWVTSTEILALEKVEVRGVQRLTRREVLAQAHLDRFDNLLDLSLWKIRQSLMEDPWIKAVAVHRHFPHGLRIEVEEEVPFFWRQKEERIYYADKHGELIAPVDVASFTSLPLLVCNPDLRRDQRDLGIVTKKWSQNQIPFGLGEVSWIRFGTDNRLQIRLQNPALEVMLGRDNLQVNIGRLRFMWRDVQRRDELGMVAYILVFEGTGWVGYRSDVV
jgi:cell division protein FtsQ